MNAIGRPEIILRHKLTHLNSPTTASVSLPRCITLQARPCHLVESLMFATVRLSLGPSQRQPKEKHCIAECRDVAKAGIYFRRASTPLASDVRRQVGMMKRKRLPMKPFCKEGSTEGLSYKICIYKRNQKDHRKKRLVRGDMR